jgi:hypothetical protein
VGKCGHGILVIPALGRLRQEDLKPELHNQTLSQKPEKKNGVDFSELKSDETTT